MNQACRILFSVILFSLLFSLYSCGGTATNGGGGISNPSLLSISVTPPNSSIALGTSIQLKAIGIYSDNTNQDLTNQVVWSSSSATIVTASNLQGTRGLASSLMIGTTSIMATTVGLTGSSNLTVTPAVVTSISVTPQNPSIPIGIIIQFTAMGTFSDGSSQDLTNQVAWSSSDTAISTISNTTGSHGLLIAVSAGTANIKATFSGVSGSTMLTVSTATLTGVSVAPSIPGGFLIGNNLTMQLIATGLFSDGMSYYLTTQVNWISSNTTAATVSNIAGFQGQITTLSSGIVTITAIYGGISGSTTFTVRNGIPLTSWAQVSAGGNHTIGISSDGTLWEWGVNINVMYSPVQIGNATNWNVAAAGGIHSVAIQSNGTLWAWGGNLYGNLGDGTTVNKTLPVQIGTNTNWASITAGNAHSVGLKRDGTLWAWGRNNLGQLGDGTLVDKLIPTQIGTDTNWKAISSGLAHVVAIKTDGTLWAWGSNMAGQLGDGTLINKLVPTQIGTDTNWSLVSAGGVHTLAIKTDGTLWAWGRNVEGQLGDGTLIDKLVPIQIDSLSTWASISGGLHHSMALMKNGTLWAWGNNSVGQFGNGSVLSMTTYQTVPLQIGTDINWGSVSVGFNHSTALKNNMTLWSWGLNDFGQVGNASIYKQLIPVLIP